MKIALPEGYQPPDTAQPGQPFEAVATLVDCGDGTFKLQSIDGNEVKPCCGCKDDGDKGDGEKEMGPRERLAASVKLPWSDDDGEDY